MENSRFDAIVQLAAEVGAGRRNRCQTMQAILAASFMDFGVSKVQEPVKARRTRKSRTQESSSELNEPGGVTSVARMNIQCKDPNLAPNGYCDNPVEFDNGPEGLFAKTCHNHDVCYATCGKSALDCNIQFKADMQIACNQDYSYSISE